MRWSLGTLEQSSVVCIESRHTWPWVPGVVPLLLGLTVESTIDDTASLNTYEFPPTWILLHYCLRA